MFKRKLLTSKFHSLASLTIFTHHFLIGITHKLRSVVSIHHMGQRMAIPLFRFGVRISWTWEMTSDATSVQKVLRLI